MLKTKVSGDFGDEHSLDMFKVSYTPERIGTFSIDILSEIVSADQFSNAIKILEEADDQNGVKINLQSPGGSVEAVDYFIHSMRKCNGHIHTVATGGVHSAATFILLESDSFELSENFCALLHCGSLGNIGNTNVYLSKAEFDAKYMRKIITNAYSGFLSEEEIDSLLKGGDMWLDAEQWCARFEDREKWRAEQMGIVIPQEPIPEFQGEIVGLSGKTSKKSKPK